MSTTLLLLFACSSHGCWGPLGSVNDSGEEPGDSIGEGDDSTTPEFVYQVGSLRSWTWVALGMYSSCTLTDDGRAECWGCQYPEDETGWWNYRIDCQVPDAGFKSLTAFSTTICGLGAMGEAVCFGSEDFKDSPPLEGPFDLIDTGSGLYCGRRSDAGLTCWEEDWEQGYKEVDVGSIAAEGGFSLGLNVGCALDRDGAVTCFEEQGLGWAEDHVPPDPSLRFSDLRMGWELRPTTCGSLRDTHELLCWQPRIPKLETGVQGPVLDFDINIWQGCAIEESGALKCWDADYGGPMEAPPGLYERVWVGARHSCARRDDSRLVCWGANEAGQATPP